MGLPFLKFTNIEDSEEVIRAIQYSHLFFGSFLKSFSSFTLSSRHRSINYDKTGILYYKVRFYEQF